MEATIFHNLCSEASYHHLYFILSATQANPNAVWEGATGRVWISGSEAHWGRLGGCGPQLSHVVLGGLALWIAFCEACVVDGGASGKEPACQSRTCKGAGFIPGSRRSPGGGHGKLLHYSCLENHMDREAWWAIAHGVAKSWTWLKWLSTHALITIAQSERIKCLGINLSKEYKKLFPENYKVFF